MFLKVSKHMIQFYDNGKTTNIHQKQSHVKMSGFVLYNAI